MPFLAASTHWVEQQQQIIFRHGRLLTAEEQQLAARVGVACPARIYVYELPSIKRPQEPELAALCDQFGFLTQGTIGLTLGYGIYIKQWYLSIRLLSHELRHVQQYEQAGSTEAFLSRYIAEIMQFGYVNAPYEIDARAHEMDSML